MTEHAQTQASPAEYEAEAEQLTKLFLSSQPEEVIKAVFTKRIGSKFANKIYGHLTY